MSDLRSRVVAATLAEVAENGLGALTVEAVATRAGSSRATLYRHFPGGRDEIVAVTIGHEIDRFVDDALPDDALPDEALPGGGAAALVDHVVRLVEGTHRFLESHDLLQRLLHDEAEAIVPQLATVRPLIEDALAAHLADVIRRSGVATDVRPADAGEFCARMLLSFVGSHGAWDLDDPDQLRALVAGPLLGGVLHPPL